MTGLLLFLWAIDYLGPEVAMLGVMIPAVVGIGLRERRKAKRPARGRR